MSTTPVRLDQRAARFAAGVAAVLLTAALFLGPALGLPVLSLQLAAFTAGALLGLRLQPWVWAFRRFVGPRLRPPHRLSDEAPLRLVQSVGLGLALLAALGSLLGQPVVFYLGGGGALLLAAVGAATGLPRATASANPRTAAPSRAADAAVADPEVRLPESPGVRQR